MNTYSIAINDIKLNKVLLKQLKQLSRNTTGEQLKIFDDDLAIISTYNNKPIGMCNISMVSPEKHFDNENELRIPYLYNYMCAQSERKRKASVAIMQFVVQTINTGDYAKRINLDVLTENTHAQNFFKKNNFTECGFYTQSTKEYTMFTCCL